MGTPAAEFFVLNGRRQVHQKEWLEKALMWFATAIKYEAAALEAEDPSTSRRLMEMSLKKACDLELMALGFAPIYLPTQHGPLWEAAGGEKIQLIEAAPWVPPFNPKGTRTIEHYPEETVKRGRGRIDLLPL